MLGDLTVWTLDILGFRDLFFFSWPRGAKNLEKLIFRFQFSLGYSCFFNFFPIVFANKIESLIKVFQM